MSCENHIQQVQLCCPVGQLSIIGCSNGLHSVKLTKLSDEENWIPKSKCSIVDQSINKKDLFVSIQDTIDWFILYFTIDKVNCSSLEYKSVVAGKYPQICPSLGLTKFQRDVYQTLVSKVPFGSRISYNDLANESEHANASRAVGTAMKNNSFVIMIPCHRVVTKSGDIGNYGCGRNVKQYLLQFEQSIQQ